MLQVRGCRPATPTAPRAPMHPPQVAVLLLNVPLIVLGTLGATPKSGGAPNEKVLDLKVLDLFLLGEATAHAHAVTQSHAWATACLVYVPQAHAGVCWAASKGRRRPARQRCRQRARPPFSARLLACTRPPALRPPTLRPPAPAPQPT